MAARRTSRSTSPSTGGPGLARPGRRRDHPDPARGVDPDATAAFVVGPEIMMRFTARELVDAGLPRRPDLDLDGAQHEVRHRRCAVTASSAPRWSAGTAPSSGTADRALPGREGAVTTPKLAVWKFASCDGCQLTLLDCEDELLAVAGAVEIAHFLEATSRRSAARTTSRWSRARSPPRTTSSGSARCAASRRSWSRSAPAPPPAASRRCGTSPTWRSSPRSSTPTPESSTAGHVDADLGPRAGRLRAARLPDRQAPAAGGGDRLPARAPAGRPGLHGVHRVQAPRDDLRHRSPTARPASVRSRRPAAARSARPTRAAATAASARWRRRTLRRSERLRASA